MINDIFDNGFQKFGANLTLITSEACNLHCKYCEIAATTAQNHCYENEKIKKAMLDGSFLNNIQKIFEKYDLNYYQIDSIELWGEEPTLTLDAFNEMFKKLYFLFPNVFRISFSTNCIQNMDSLYNYIKNINTIVNKKGFHIEIQISYDGKWSTENLRGIDPNIIKQNFEYLIKKLNDLKFRENIKLTFAFHNVLSFELIDYINSNQGIENYWYELNNFYEYFKNININPNIHLANFSYGVIAPYNATKEDGIKYADFLIKTEHIIQQYEKMFTPINSFSLMLKSVEQSGVNKNLENDMMNFIFKHFQQRDVNSYCGCGTGLRLLKIRYNGQIIHCQNAIFGLTDNDNNQNIDTFRKNIRKDQIQIKYTPNLLTDPDEYIHNWMYKWGTVTNNDTIIQMLCNTANLMNILSELDQIDISYKYDQKKVIRHSFYFVLLYSCWENNLNYTGSIFGEQLGRIRMYANGYLDEIEKVLKNIYESDQEIKDKRKC